MLLSNQQITEIINLLLKTDISLRKIAKQYEVDLCIIIGIKNGNIKKYKRQGLNYPLRKNN